MKTDLMNLRKVLAVLLALLCGSAMAKECSNSVSQSSKDSFKYHADDEIRRQKQLTYATYNINRTDEEPRDVLALETMYEQSAPPGQHFKVPQDHLREVSLHDVRLEPNSLHWKAQQLNLEYMLMLDVDRLVWSFRKTAGLPTPGTPYGGWENSTHELRGHFVGHYLSATALMWASTHNDTVKESMTAVVNALSECQEKMGSGYLSAFPTELFDRIERLDYAWPPYYTIHKILAGLLDQYTYADNAQALKMVKWMVDYFYTRIQNHVVRYSIAKFYVSQNSETGGMNDLLYKLYAITKNQKHLVLAHLFDKPCFLGLLAVKSDELNDFHSNTHIPLVVGAQTRYEVIGDPLYRDIARFFLSNVNSSHTFATGGTSIEEFWREPRRLASYLISDNEETCSTYNMLKVSRSLFRWSKDASYADFYERAMANGILGVQRGEPGVMIYFLPQAPGGSKSVSHWGWGTPFESFWCCYGSALESFSKLGDTIYFEEPQNIPGLYIIQYISSTFDWKLGNVVLNQTVNPVVSWDPYLNVTITFSEKSAGDKAFSLKLRVPIWTQLNGAKAAINGHDLPLPAPGKFLTITRKWSHADKITLQLPLTLRLERIKDDRPEYSSLHGILYGPYLLAGHTHGDWDIDAGSDKSVSSWLAPIPPAYNNYLVTFSQNSGNSTLYLLNIDQNISMSSSPKPGTNEALQSTFRIILAYQNQFANFSTIDDAVGKSVKLEPFDYPGAFVVHNELDNTLGVARQGYSVFNLVKGLNGKPGTVSLESQSLKDCYVLGGLTGEAGTALKLSCYLDKSNPEIAEAASFKMDNGMSRYHPISFVANGAKRNFLLEPLLAYRDETYTPYFNI